jgi:glutamyl/glutaminyl-tRNA synthetase
MKQNTSWIDAKLVSVNKTYIQGKAPVTISLDPKIQEYQLTTGKLKEYLKPFLVKNNLWSSSFEEQLFNWFSSVLQLLKARAETLLDLVESFRPFYSSRFDYDFDLVAIHKHIAPNDAEILNLFWAISERLDKLEAFDAASIQTLLKTIAAEQNVKVGVICNAIRVAITGEAVGASLFELMELMGRYRVVYRLRKLASDEGYLMYLASAPITEVMFINSEPFPFGK